MDYNRWTAVGKIEHRPPITEANGRKQMSFNFIVNDRRPDANKQYTDHPMKVPVFAFDSKAELMEKYVVDGQELMIDCKYINWDDNGTLRHGFVVLSVVFGFKPKGSGGNAPADTGGGPPM